MVERAIVAVVDDSESVRESLAGLLQHVGYGVQTFSSAETFLASEAVGLARCLILDIRLPGMSGPDLQEELARRGKIIPIVFITAHADREFDPPLMHTKSVACLLKPFSDTALLEAVEAALQTGQ